MTSSYATNTVTATDATGKQRKSQSDAAGRLAIVFEPDPTNGNQLLLQTSYTYSVLDELTRVTQGAQTRTYVYDALGRILSATTPEAGRVCFGSVSGSTCNADGYDSFDNLLKRTDARGVVTNYSYDGLNRLYQVSYNVGSTGVPATSPVTLTYGTSASSYNNGRLITMTDGVGSENYTYNNLGQMTQLQKVISGTTYTTAYAYNLANELTQITYPSGRVVQQAVDAIGRLSSITGTLNSVNTTYASGYTHDPSTGVLLTGFNYGNGINVAFGYSPDRLQLNCLDYSTTNRNGNCAHDSTTKFGLSYNYGASGSNNGLISGITDNVDSGRSATYTYDSLFRLSTAATAGSAGYPAWGLSETYDRYGNRTTQRAISGCTAITCPQPSVTVNTSTNQLIGSPYAYDLNGNMTNDGANTLVYDAEDHAVSATNGGSSGTYTYDGNGLRVKKVSTISGSTTRTVYVFSGSKVIAEYVNGAAPSAPTREYIYSGAALLAKIDSAGTRYYHQDHLSNRLVTDSSGNTFAQMGHFPFGESWYNGSNDKLIFTTYERDSESGNDYTLARYYVSGLARFSSPDPVAGSTGNPQSLNRYAYVGNTPVTFTDSTGLGKDCNILKNFTDPRTFEVVGGFSDGDDLNSVSDPPGGWCGGGGGGGGFCPTITLDGGIVDCSTSPDTGFPIGAGSIGQILNLALTPTGSHPNPDWWTTGCIEYFDCGNIPAFLPEYGNSLSLLFGQEPPPDIPNPSLPTVDLNLLPIKPAPLPLECRPEFIAEARAAWQRGGYGFRNTEAGFTVRGSWSSPTYIPAPFTNQYMRLSFKAYPNDVAFFHTHPNSGSRFPSPPSTGGVDQTGYLRPGDNQWVQVYTASRAGLFVSDPTSPNGYTQSRNGLDWLNPCF